MEIAAFVYDLRWIITVVLLGAYSLQKIRTYYRLSSFKGPWGSGWSELWHVRAILGLKSHLKYDEVCRKYGKFENNILQIIPQIEYQAEYHRTKQGP